MSYPQDLSAGSTPSSLDSRSNSCRAMISHLFVADDDDDDGLQNRRNVSMSKARLLVLSKTTAACGAGRLGWERGEM